MERAYVALLSYGVFVGSEILATMDLLLLGDACDNPGWTTIRSNAERQRKNLHIVPSRQQIVIHQILCDENGVFQQVLVYRIWSLIRRTRVKTKHADISLDEKFRQLHFYNGKITKV